MIRKTIQKLLVKSGLARPETWLKQSLGVETSYAGVEVTPASALASSTVAACVRLLSESVASLPLHVYRRGDKGKERAPEHPLYSILHDRPNPYMTSFNWRALMVSHVALHGNSYNVIERDSGGRVSALWPLDPACVIVKNAGGALVYEAWIGGERRTFEYSEVLHVRGPSLDGITGLSVIKIAKQGIGLDLAMTQHGASLFKNGARPGVVLKHPESLSGKTQTQLLDNFAAKFAGALNSGKPFLLEGGLDVQVLGFSSDDAQFLQSRQFSVQEICRFFRVSPHLVGDPSRLAYASSEAEFNAFLTHTLAPWLRNLESEMNVSLLPDRTEFLIEFDPNGMARGSLAERYAAYQKGLAGPNPWLTVADVRAAENLPFLPGTDQLPTAKEVSHVAA